jgi:ABC-type nitrate/sulfonate/bicarbonate transport system ATPase subunit
MAPYKNEELILSCKGLNVNYGDKKILKDINFDIHNITRPNMTQGQIIALVGQSGIGKTSLFRSLAGFEKPTSGEILIGLEQKPVKIGNVGVVTQSYNLLEHLKVKGNLLLTGRKLEEVEALASEFDMLKHFDKFPAQLSGGQRQRIAILQQVLKDNDFILLDEPFSGLDPIMLKKTVSLIQRTSTMSEMKTFIIVSHDLLNCSALADTIFLLTKPVETEGASINYKYDLAEMGLAWTPDIKKNKMLYDIIEDIEKKM